MVASRRKAAVFPKKTPEGERCHLFGYADRRETGAGEWVESTTRDVVNVTVCAPAFGSTIEETPQNKREGGGCHPPRARVVLSSPARPLVRFRFAQYETTTVVVNAIPTRVSWWAWTAGYTPAPRGAIEDSPSMF